MKQTTYEIEIEGITPYLMHRFADEGADVSSQRKVGKKDYKSDVEVALYKSPEGEIYVPATQIKSCLMEAGKQMRIPGKGKSTYSKLFGAFIMIEPDCLVMSPQEYEVDARAVVIQRARIIRYRPIFKKWGLRFKVHSLTEEIQKDVIKEGFEIAGNFTGIGDFRPQKKGMYGRFMVVSFKEVN